MALRKIVFFCSFLTFSLHWACGQQVDVSILQQGTGFKDSAYYDIIKTSETNYWLVGKYGIITNYNSTNNSLSPVNYPSYNRDIYKIARLNSDNYIACADKGTLYFYNNPSQSWRAKEVAGYENSCFYNIVVLNEKTALICGGRSSIAHSAKTIPNGFIIKTTDGGETWTRVFSSPFKMVWAVRFNETTQELLSLIYTPNHTTLYSSKDEGDNWQSVKKLGRGIYYDLEVDVNKNLLCYGGKINGNGKVWKNGEQETMFKESGLIWSKTRLLNLGLMTACDGNVLFSHDEQQWELIHTELSNEFSLYKAEFINKNKALVVGSGRTVLLLNINTSLTLE